MATKLKQSTLTFGAPATKQQVISITTFDNTKPDWFPVDFWTYLTPTERQIHIIAYNELGSSYTVDSTQQYIKWIKSKTK